MSTALREKKRAKPAGGVTVTRQALHQALARVADAVPAKSAKPILSNVLLCDGQLSATDLELRISTPLPGSDGLTIVLPHQRLTSIVNSLHATVEVTITQDGNTAVVQSSGGTWRLPVEDHLEYPRGQDVEPTWIAHLPADQFVALMGSVRLATDNESSRYALGGVLVQWKDGMLTLVATDGRRMSVAEVEVDQATDEACVIVPRDAVDSLCKLAKGASLVQLGHAGNQLIAEVDEHRVQAVLVQGNFPRWADADPKRTITPSLVVVGSLLSACRQAAICESEASRGVTFAFTKDGLHLTSRSAEAGEASVTCDLVEPGHSAVVKLDPRFVTEWLACGSFDMAETIEIEAEDAQSAVVLRSQDSRCVIMPLAKD